MGRGNSASWREWEREPTQKIGKTWLGYISVFEFPGAGQSPRGLRGWDSGPKRNFPEVRMVSRETLYCEDGVIHSVSNKKGPHF